MQRARAHSLATNKMAAAAAPLLLALHLLGAVLPDQAAAEAVVRRCRYASAGCDGDKTCTEVRGAPWPATAAPPGSPGSYVPRTFVPSPPA
eukprot:SAG22_NODE_1017_length_6016_cov_40.662667_9_plen_91_part_00